MDTMPVIEFVKKMHKKIHTRLTSFWICDILELRETMAFDGLK